MKRHFAPLGIFVVGNLGLLIASIFLPAVDTAQSQLATDTANMTANFWGWSWMMTSGVVRWIYWLVGEGCILFAVGVAFIKGRPSR